MKSAALYIRCARPSATSVKRQKDRCIQFATRQGFLVSETHIYVDYGVSGRRLTLERTGLMSLREEMSHRSFQAVVVEDLSRLFQVRA